MNKDTDIKLTTTESNDSDDDGSLLSLPSVDQKSSKPTTSSSNKLVPCIVERKPGLYGKISFSLQNADGSESLVMTAKRGNILSRSQFTIHDDKDERIGSLVQIRSDMTAHAYLLKKQNKNEKTEKEFSAMFMYKVPPITAIIKGKPRHVETMFIPADGTTSIINKKPHDFSNELKTTIPLAIDLVHMEPMSKMSTATSVEPYKKPNGRYGLNFKGRGRITSPKNIQLALDSTSESPSSEMIFQMAKWDKKVYNVDYSTQLGAFPAFGMVLAQLAI